MTPPREMTCYDPDDWVASQEYAEDEYAGGLAVILLLDRAFLGVIGIGALIGLWGFGFWARWW